MNALHVVIWLIIIEGQNTFWPSFFIILLYSGCYGVNEDFLEFPYFCPQIPVFIGIVINYTGWGSRSPWLEISTQTAKIRRIGRDSHCRRPEISTQTAKISRIGRDSRSPRPEISTKMGEIGRIGRDSNFRRSHISSYSADISHMGRNFMGWGFVQH